MITAFLLTGDKSSASAIYTGLSLRIGQFRVQIGQSHDINGVPRGCLSAL